MYPSPGGQNTMEVLLFSIARLPARPRRLRSPTPPLSSSGAQHTVHICDIYIYIYIYIIHIYTHTI